MERYFVCVHSRVVRLLHLVVVCCEWRAESAALLAVLPCYIPLLLLSVQACVERDCYPSPLNYFRFPKSCCT